MSIILTTDNQSVKSRTDQIAFFDSIHCSFVANANRSKNPIAKNWQSSPSTAKSMNNHSGNIGIALGKFSGNLIALDADERFPEFLAAFPVLKSTTIITRKDAPDRGKVLIRLRGDLPRSANHTIKGSHKPVFELLSTGRQAIVIGTHPDGATYECNWLEPIELEIGDLSAIWRKWTGTELNQANRPKKTDVAQSDNALAQLVKAHWTCMDVFNHFGMDAESQLERNGEVRLKGHGGLLIDDSRDIFIIHASRRGGDCIAAWALMTLDKIHTEDDEFVQICREMLEVKGIPFPEFKAKLNFDPDAALAWASDVSTYPKDRYNSYNRIAMIQLINRMVATGKATISMSVRELSELAGMSDMSAHKTLKRLIALQLIERVTDVGNQLLSDTETVADQFTGKQLAAYCYRLTEKALLNLSTRITNSTVVETVLNSSTPKPINQSIVSRYADHDFFQFGAKVADTGLATGRACLDVIGALSSNGEMNSKELAEITGRSRQTCAEKAGVLVMLGLVQKSHLGHDVRYYLVDAWEDILSQIVKSMTTLGTTIKRKIRHIEDRLRLLDQCLNRWLSDGVRKKLQEMIKRLQEQMFTLGRHLSAMFELRSEIFAI